jgi:hypothetical protein
LAVNKVLDQFRPSAGNFPDNTIVIHNPVPSGVIHYGEVMVSVKTNHPSENVGLDTGWRRHNIKLTQIEGGRDRQQEFQMRLFNLFKGQVLLII